MYDFASLFENADEQYQFDSKQYPYANVMTLFLRARDNMSEYYSHQLRAGEFDKEYVERQVARKPKANASVCAYAAATVKDFCVKNGIKIPDWVKRQKPAQAISSVFDAGNPLKIADQSRPENQGQTADIFRSYGCFVKDNHTSYC